MEYIKYVIDQTISLLFNGKGSRIDILASSLYVTLLEATRKGEKACRVQAFVK